MMSCLWMYLSLLYLLQHSVSSDQEFIWDSRDGIIECKNASTKYICDWDRRSYVFLNISDVNNNTSVSVEIRSKCGLDVSPFITVNVSVVEPERNYKEESRSNWILGVYWLLLLPSLLWPFCLF
ncbi:hypothetical protein ATANTOWER_001804 [Ataeniobius toweri]|uniref:Uncharacterized protein n=1 Tax=Ataeniobius toweri TaxID=208326 RepID=A0ABU7A4H1_9TELE|nr:hypothetical protein [Ataeniobius toweri]